MNDKPPHEWTDKELADQERTNPRRRQHFTFWGLVVAVFAILWSIIATVAGLL
jgi:hypothetical protein